MRGRRRLLFAGIQIKIKGKASHWSEADKGIDSIYAGVRAVQEIHDLNHSYKGDAPCLVGIGTAHGGEYANIIADSMVLTGNIRACREEDFYGLYHELQKRLKKTEKETGAQNHSFFFERAGACFCQRSRIYKACRGNREGCLWRPFFPGGGRRVVSGRRQCLSLFPENKRDIFGVFGSKAWKSIPSSPSQDGVGPADFFL